VLFNSYEFLLAFLPATLLLFFLAGRFAGVRAAVFVLVGASFIFYAYWKPEYVVILLGSLVGNYLLSLGFDALKQTRKKALLIIGISANLLMLGVYKYTDFFIENVNFFSGAEYALPHFVLPLAISFFTFQQIAFLVDSYRGMVREKNFLNYALFVTFFPQLIAGPIVHHSEMMPQFARGNVARFNSENFARGFFILSVGLFKKVIIADKFAMYATAGFDHTQILNFQEAWVTGLAYTFQLYFDFSGYTDMAIGLGWMFNIKLPFNFNSPYKALDIQDFWRRWHITLSRFLRDYLYIPLGGNRLGSVYTYRNLFLTFLLGGIWHGAGWTFVVWGAMHGLGTMAHRAWKNRGFNLPTLPAWLITFLFVHVAWVFFRALSFSDALKVLSGMVGISGFGRVGLLGDIEPFGRDVGQVFLITFLIIWFLPNTNKFSEKFSLHLGNVAVHIIAFFIALLSLNQISEFIYFGF
jgi:D-alanyl-lipoteichoic acid acyltransferase DltB (MBOAT superfamily)